MQRWLVQALMNLSKSGARTEAKAYAEHKDFAEKDLSEFLCEFGSRNVPAEFICTEFQHRGMSWRKDPVWGIINYVSEPWVTWYRKTGDCGDFSRLYYECLNRLGHSLDRLSLVSFLTVKWFTSKGHSVCTLAESPTKFKVFSNLNYLGEYTNLRYAADAVWPTWTHIVPYDVNMKILDWIKK